MGKHPEDVALPEALLARAVQVQGGVGVAMVPAVGVAHQIGPRWADVKALSAKTDCTTRLRGV